MCLSRGFPPPLLEWVSKSDFSPFRLGRSRWAEKPVRMDNRRVAPSRVCSHRFCVFAQINTHNIKCIVQVSNCAHFIWTTKCCSIEIEIEKLNAEETFCKAKFPNEIALPKIEKKWMDRTRRTKNNRDLQQKSTKRSVKSGFFRPFCHFKI